MPDLEPKGKAARGGFKGSVSRLTRRGVADEVLSGVLQLGPDRRERRIEFRTDHFRAYDEGHRDERSDKAVLDSGRARLVVDEAIEERLHGSVPVLLTVTWPGVSDLRP